MEFKTTKEINNLREAIKAQDLDINFYISTAESIVT